MARGWESKSIEDQIAEREAESERAAKKKLTAREMEQQTRREGLLLARARTLTALKSARDERYRTQLERALAHLDVQLAELDLEDSS